MSHFTDHPPVFIILSFEGPDAYSWAGGLGARVTELSETLADTGFETHVFFIGDPSFPGHESMVEGKLHLHRWCQWISQYHGRLLRQRARRSARHYSWPAVLKRRLLPLTHPRVPEPPADGRVA